MSRLAIAVCVTASGALSLGAVSGYLVARKQLELKYEQMLTEEIEKTRQYYQILHKGEGYSTIHEAAETLGVESKLVVEAAKAVVSYQGKSTTPIVGSQLVNVFHREEGADELPTEEELAARSDKAPYIISNEEYESNESEYDQQVVTWYVNDETLADEYDEMLHDHYKLVGNENLQRFGMRSKDSNVVFVRNDRLKIDYQILRSTDSYAEVVGFGKK